LVQDSFAGVTSSVYDAANHLSSRQFSGTGQSPLRIDFTYNGTDQPATGTRYSDLAGTQKVGSTTYSYDADNRLNNLQFFTGGGASLASYSYTFDAAGNVLTQTINGTTTTFAYDVTNQLTTDGATGYTYDATGNRTNTGYTTGTGNQVTSDGTWTYSYDAEGNLIKKTKGASAETWTFGYDHLNHMVWAEQRSTDGGTLLMRADYTYDAFGNRIQKVVNSGGSTTTTQYLLDGWKGGADGWGRTADTVDNENWDVWGEFQVGHSGLQARNFRGDAVDQLFGQLTSDGIGVLWLLADRLGTVRDITDGTGQLVNHIEFTAFGSIVSQSGSPSTRYFGVGRDFDAETGMWYARARYYDSGTGRWTTQDAMGFDAGDSNFYRYVHNMPTGATDPSGLDGLDAQKVARTGVPKKRVDDISGPDVTDWFVRDIVDQIEYRAKMISKNIDNTGGVPRVRPEPDLRDFKKQVAYYLAPKWIDFGSPDHGRGVNTVVVERRVLRKNQLGNIEFGIISDLMPPPLPGIIKNPIEFAYGGTLFNDPTPVFTYWTEHFHSDNFGKFKGLVRADNLAAYGVGHGIATYLRLNAAGTLKEIQRDVRGGKFEGLTKAQRQQLTKQVAAALRAFFATDDNALGRRVNTYNKLLSKKLDSGELRIPIKALFFVPEYDGGFNTESLTRSGVKNPVKLTSREYFEKVLQPAYEQYKKDLGDRAFDIDDWLRKYREDYAKYKQPTWKR
jgi:RHS repeat-associated protein